MAQCSNKNHTDRVIQVEDRPAPKSKSKKTSRKPRAFFDAAPDAPWSPEMQEFAKLIENKFGRYSKQWQGQVIMAALKGHDVLIRARTGMGKSLPIQALLFSNLTGIVLMIVPILASGTL